MSVMIIIIKIIILLLELMKMNIVDIKKFHNTTDNIIHNLLIMTIIIK